MRFDLDGLEVLFPYDYVYPEQYNYMLELKRSLDAKGHCLLEMPTGTGKTISVLSLVLAYQHAHPETGKLVYCTRTVPEMTKAMEELRKLVAYRGEQNLLGVCLSARRNMCVHPRVVDEADRERVDSMCRDMTASWVRERAEAGDADVETCTFFEEYERNGSDAVLESGIYNLDDLQALGRERGWCPYYLARHVITYANVIVFNYQYMLDPRIAGLVSRELEAESVVVFDEAHNIDNVCIEALSVDVDRQRLDQAQRNIGRLSGEVQRLKASDAERLNAEYRRLVQGLNPEAPAADVPAANPALPDDILAEAVPGNIRRAEHFLGFMKRIVKYLKTRVAVQAVESESPMAFLHHMSQALSMDPKPLKFCYSRLRSLMTTLQVTNLDEYGPLKDVADLATLVATYSQGFAVIIEPTHSHLPGVHDPILQLCCLDSSLAIKPVLDRFSTVVITSGTLSPIDLYPKLLHFDPVIRTSLPMSIFRSCICPVVVTRGSDQLPISTKFDMRDDPAVTRNYGALLIEFASLVPDGMVCFFPSYEYMERMVTQWEAIDVLRQVLEHKLVFIETKDVVETTLALDNFKRACDCGRGAVFLSVARGKVAEGIDFDRHYGRAVLLMGIPFQYTLSPVLRARLTYLRETYQVRESDFLTFDAIRQAAQCVGRVIRSKTDYGLMVFADSRYNRFDKRNKLPPWVTQFLGEAHLNLSTDMAAAMARQFLREMAQPLDRRDQKGALLSEEDVRQLGAAAGNEFGGTLRAPTLGSVAAELGRVPTAQGAPPGVQFSAEEAHAHAEAARQAAAAGAGAGGDIDAEMEEAEAEAFAASQGGAKKRRLEED